MDGEPIVVARRHLELKMCPSAPQRGLSAGKDCVSVRMWGTYLDPSLRTGNGKSRLGETVPVEA
jgi:hypothetical protein